MANIDRQFITVRDQKLAYQVGLHEEGVRWNPNHIARITGVYDSSFVEYNVVFTVSFDVTHAGGLRGSLEDLCDWFETFFEQSIETLFQSFIFDSGFQGPQRGTMSPITIPFQMVSELRSKSPYPCTIEKISLMGESAEEEVVTDNKEVVKHLENALRALGYAVVTVAPDQLDGDSIGEVERRLKRYI